MIGRKQLPEAYLAWNDKWGAPFGYAGNVLAKEGRSPYANLRESMRDPGNAEHGPFGFQHNSYTRIYEYPWAYFNAGLEPGMRVLDIGGGTGGLQYVAAMEGCEVVNADPAGRPDFNEWSDPQFARRHDALNQVFLTKVELIPAQVQAIDLPAESFDRIFCLSVLEHVDPDEATEMVVASAGLLKPGGLLVLSVDLFLDLKPFGVLDRNLWGVNHNIHDLVSKSGLDLIAGDRTELLGFPEFDLDKIVGELDELLVSKVYPVMTQTLVLAKPRS